MFHIDGLHRADRAAPYDVARPNRRRVVDRVERLDEDLPGILGLSLHDHRLLGVLAHRLLAEHVLARAEGRDRERHVERVRQRVVDGVDRLIREQLLVAAVRGRDTVRVGKLLRALEGSRRHRHDCAREQQAAKSEPHLQACALQHRALAPQQRRVRVSSAVVPYSRLLPRGPRWSGSARPEPLARCVRRR